MASVKELLARCPQPPPAPATAVRVLSLVRSGDYDIRQIERIVRADEALSFGVLKLANSAAFGAAGRSFDLAQSITRLGAKNLSKFILSQSAHELFDDAGSAYGLRRQDLWRGAVGGAIAAELLAVRHKYKDPSMAYVCGLLRDVGKLVIERTYGRSAPGLMNAARDSSCQLQREREIFGVDHAELGAALAEHWNLPDPIPAAIRYHHEPPVPTDEHHSDLYDIIHAADITALWAGLAIGVDGLEYRLAPHVKERLHLNIREVESEIAETWSRVNEIEAMLAGNTGVTP